MRYRSNFHTRICRIFLTTLCAVIFIGCQSISDPGDDQQLLPPETGPEPQSDSPVPGSDIREADEQTRIALQNIFRSAPEPHIRYNFESRGFQLIFTGAEIEPLTDPTHPLSQTDLFWEYEITQLYQGTKFALQSAALSTAHHQAQTGFSLQPYNLPEDPSLALPANSDSQVIPGYLPDQPVSITLRLRVAPFSDQGGLPFPALASWDLSQVDLNAPVSSQGSESPANSAPAGVADMRSNSPGVQTLILPDSLAKRPLMQFIPEILPTAVSGSAGTYRDSSPYLSLNPPKLLGSEPVATFYDLKILNQGFQDDMLNTQESPAAGNTGPGSEPRSISIPQNTLLPGVFPLEIRRQDVTGAFAPASGFRRTFITQDAVTTRGIGLSLPASSWILPGTRFFALPVFGAQEYQLISPVGNSSEVQPVQSNSIPEFNLPRIEESESYQVVFSAMASGRPLLEIPLSLKIIEQPPSILQVSTENFTGSVFQHEMTAHTAAALLNNLYNQGFIRRRQSNPSIFEDSLGSHTVLGLSLLDYGRQFSIGFSSAFEATTGKELHPAVGISQAGARLVAWAYTMLFDPTHYKKVYPHSWWNPLELEFTGSGDPLSEVFRLPTQREWSSLAQAPNSFQPTENTTNYYRSFDPYEDPNPPFLRNGGPTTPVAFFPPDSIFGLHDTRGNVWEWARDIVTQEERPDLFRGPVSRHPIYRRVLGGAWNTPLEEYGPRGSQIPLGWFGEDFTSYSIGIRLFSSIQSSNLPAENPEP